MAEFKSSFIGGYSKKSVNEYVSKLENENDILKKALDLAEHNALKADKYYNENTKLNNEIAQLNEVVAELNEKLAEIRERRKYYEEHPEEVERIIEEGSAKARVKAQAVLAEVRKLVKMY